MQTMNINIDQQMISKIERNNRIVTDYELACLCRILNVNIDDMIKNVELDDDNQWTLCDKNPSPIGEGLFIAWVSVTLVGVSGRPHRVAPTVDARVIRELQIYV